MKSKFLFSLLCLLSLFVYPFLEDIFAKGNSTVNTGDNFPDISLTGPFCQEDKQYLGFSNRKSYFVSSIKAEFLLVNFFSIYCPICQAHANKFNRLYKLIQEDTLINRNLKIIGIGLGNNRREVDYFKKYHDVPFPLIPDPDFKIHKALKETRTPLLAIIDKRSNPYKILTILDFTKEPEVLLKDIRTQLLKYKTAK